MATVDADFIHTWQRKIAGYLNNPFLIQCRENSFRREIHGAARFAPHRSRVRASHSIANAAAPARSDRESIRRRARRRRAQSPDRAKLRSKVIVDLAWRCT